MKSKNNIQLLLFMFISALLVSYSQVNSIDNVTKRNVRASEINQNHAARKEGNNKNLN